MRTVHTDLIGSVKADAQKEIPSFVMQTDATGPVLTHHGDFIFLGELQSRTGDRRMTITIGQTACTCGCGAQGRGMMYTPEVQHARDIAAQLLQLADTIEAGARLAANAAIRKAAGR